VRIWGRRTAFNVQKALWMLGEVGADCEHVEAGGAAGGLDAHAFLAMNPNGLIPVLEADGIYHWESHTIVRYLAARFAAGTLWPLDPAERSLADRWLDWTLADLGPAFMRLFWSYYRTPEQTRDERRIAQAARDCDRSYGLLDRHLAQHRFLAGDRFTMGDVPAGTTLYRFFEMGHPTPALPNVRRWYAALAEREAFRAHIMIPFDELRGRLAF
jgi:glutathione S-transferase